MHFVSISNTYAVQKILTAFLGYLLQCCERGSCSVTQQYGRCASTRVFTSFLHHALLCLKVLIKPIMATLVTASWSFTFCSFSSCYTRSLSCQSVCMWSNMNFSLCNICTLLCLSCLCYISLNNASSKPKG